MKQIKILIFILLTIYSNVKTSEVAAKSEQEIERMITSYPAFESIMNGMFEEIQKIIAESVHAYDKIDPSNPFKIAFNASLSMIADDTNLENSIRISHIIFETNRLKDQLREGLEKTLSVPEKELIIKFLINRLDNKIRELLKKNKLLEDYLKTIKESNSSDEVNKTKKVLKIFEGTIFSFDECHQDIQSSSSILNKCCCCKKEESQNLKLKMCSACKNKNVRYCSAYCQKADWKNHKLICKKKEADAGDEKSESS